MATIIRIPRKSRARAPQRITGINWASPLAQGLVSVTSTQPRDLVTGGEFTRNVGVAPRGGQLDTVGIEGGNGTSNDWYRALTTAEKTLTSNVSVAAWVWVNNTPSAQNEGFYTWGGGTVTDYHGVLLLAAPDGSVRCAVGNGLDSGATGRRTTLSSTTGFPVQQWNLVVATTLGGNNYADLFVNGVRDVASTSGTGNGLGYDATSATGIHGWDSGSTMLDGVLFCGMTWGRILSDIEIRALYNPATRWDIYDQGYRHISLPAAAGGGGGFNAGFAAGSNVVLGGRAA